MEAYTWGSEEAPMPTPTAPAADDLGALLDEHVDLRARLPLLRALADHATTPRPDAARRRLARRATRFLEDEVLTAAAREEAVLDRWPQRGASDGAEHLRRQHDAIRLIARSLDDVAGGAAGSSTVDLGGLLRAALALLAAHLDAEAHLFGAGAGRGHGRRPTDAPEPRRATTTTATTSSATNPTTPTTATTPTATSPTTTGGPR
jgi:hypothetical protein